MVWGGCPSAGPPHCSACRTEFEGTRHCKGPFSLFGSAARQATPHSASARTSSTPPQVVVLATGRSEHEDGLKSHLKRLPPLARHVGTLDGSSSAPLCEPSASQKFYSAVSSPWSARPAASSGG